MSGELAAGLAHEIKNPLAGIKISIEYLLEGSSFSEEQKDIMLKMGSEIRRIELLIKEFLNFARPLKPQMIAVNMNNIIDKSIAFSFKDTAFSKAINITRDFDDDLPETMADPMQLQQVFLNIFLNAVDAMPDGGTISVKTSYEPAAASIIIEISDTGNGISEELQNKIFQPFFTTKSRGTGLGLSISKRLIEQHGGSISIRNNLGGGAVFGINIPIKQEEARLA